MSKGQTTAYQLGRERLVKRNLEGKEFARRLAERNAVKRAPLVGATTDRLRMLFDEMAFGERIMRALMDEMPQAMCLGKIEVWAACGRAWIDLIAATAERRVRE